MEPSWAAGTAAAAAAYSYGADLGKERTTLVCFQTGGQVRDGRRNTVKELGPAAAITHLGEPVFCGFPLPPTFSTPRKGTRRP